MYSDTLNILKYPVYIYSNTSNYPIHIFRDPTHQYDEPTLDHIYIYLCSDTLNTLKHPIHTFNYLKYPIHISRDPTHHYDEPTLDHIYMYLCSDILNTLNYPIHICNHPILSYAYIPRPYTLVRRANARSYLYMYVFWHLEYRKLPYTYIQIPQIMHMMSCVLRPYTPHVYVVCSSSYWCVGSQNTW